MKLLFYILLFFFAFRILKKLFLPAYGSVNQQQSNTKQGHQQFNQQQNPFQKSSSSDKSNVIEDVE